MIQVIFLALLVITLFAGAFAYYAPKEKSIDPMKFMMDSSGFSSEETTNTKKTQKLNMTTNKGLVEFRREMDDLADEQNKIMDAIRDQQQLLANTSKDAADIMQKAQDQSDKNAIDVLRLKELTAQMQDQQRLLTSHGQVLIDMNNRLTDSRQWVTDQVDLVRVNTASSMDALQQHYNSLKDQADGFFDKVGQHNQEVNDQIQRMQDHLKEMSQNASENNAMQQDSAMERMGHMLENEHESMAKLAEKEECNKGLLEEAQQNLQNSKEAFQDTLQRSEDLIEKEREKAQDQKDMLQQRMEDQEQRLQDQRDR